MPAEEFDVGEDRGGERLDAFLAEHAGSRTLAARLIAEGSVTVNGKPRQKRHTVRAGDRVAIAEPAPPPVPGTETGSDAGGSVAGRGTGDAVADGSDAAAGASFRIAYEDPYLLVVDKPAGVVVHPGKGNWQGTLSQALNLEVERGGVVHRLDKETSGLLVVAKTERVQRELQQLIKQRDVHREYLTLVAGRPESRTGTIDAPIGRDRHTRTMHSLDTDTPREARTHFELAEAFATTTLLRVRLETGRTHQIRVHMQAIGHPVVGDPTYGGPRKYDLTRQFLHAARLGFTHPVTAEAIDIDSPLPPDLQHALEAARAG